MVSGLKCLVSNIRSLVKNKLSLLFLLKKYNLDVIALTETWLKASIESEPLLGDLLSQYEFIRCDRPRKKGGGVALLISNTLSPCVVFKESVPNSYELLCCDLFPYLNAVRFVVVYKAPSCPSSSADKLIKALSDIISCEQETIITGDFNLPDIDWIALPGPTASSSFSKTFTQFCATYSLHQLVRRETHGSHILDLVLTTEPAIVNRVKVESPLGFSDHSTVRFSLSMRNDNPMFIFRRNFKFANYQAIKDYLQNVDWYGSFATVSTVDAMYELLIAILNHCIELFVPLVKVQLQQRYLPPYLQTLFLKRSKSWNIAVKSNSRRDWDAFYSISNAFEKRLRKYNSHRENKIINSRSKLAFYKLLNTKLKRNSKIGTIQSDSGALIVRDDDKAEVFADIFAQVYSRGSDNQDSLDQLSGHPLYPVMDDSVWFHADEILSSLSKWPNSCSVTPDGIPSLFLKEVAPVLARPLEFIFNLCFTRAEVPSRWRTAFVIPIPKKPPANSPHSYRPISLTSILARIFEKILKKRIETHLRKHSILSPYQHGFQKGRSTVTAMLQALNEWTLSLEGGNPVDVIYLDFSKAFDRVSHARLVHRLKAIGIHPRIVAWLQSFLCDRTFKVRVNSCLSTVRHASRGVPQGSVLSPLLFNIYTYDLPYLIISNGVKCCAFADDLKIFNSVRSADDRAALQNALNVVDHWATQWKLPLSREKSKVVHLGGNNLSFSYSVDGILIEEVDQILDLGFLITKDLSFDLHCERIANAASRIVYNLFKALTTRNTITYLRAYKTYVRPLLEYGTVIFNPFKKKFVSKLESVQNSFTRKLMIRALGFAYNRIPSSHERNSNFCLATLAYRRKKHDLILFHKILHGKCDLPLDMFCVLRKSVTRGGSRKISFPKARLNCRYHFFTVRAGTSFLKISKKHKIPSSLTLFKASLDRYLGPT